MICRLIRWFSALSSHPTAPPPTWVEHHLQRCASCRAERDDLARLETQLRATAGAVRLEPPPFLAARAAHAVAVVANAPLSQGRGLARPAWLLAGGLALGLGIVGGRLWLGSPVPAPEAVAGVWEPARVSEALAVTDPASLLAASQRLDDPLQRELDLILADARTAARSLAGAFLPADRP
jgi:hypothetical protein